MKFEKLTAAVFGTGLLLANCHGSKTENRSDMQNAAEVAADETQRGKTAKVAAEQLSEEQIRALCRQFGETAAGVAWEHGIAASGSALADERITAEMECLQSRGLVRRTYGGSPIEMFQRGPRGGITHTP